MRDSRMMTNHQKNRFGNQIILDYVSRRYRLPRDQDALLFLSQLDQGDCMQVGAEHHRWNMPRCIDALFTFISPGFRHRFAFDLPGIAHRAGDNFFALYPGQPKTVAVDFPRPQKTSRLNVCSRTAPWWTRGRRPPLFPLDLPSPGAARPAPPPHPAPCPT